MSKLNKKTFLAPNSIKSMAAVHIKIYDNEDRQEYQMRISDCKNSIKLWGGLGKDDLKEGIEKMNSIMSACFELKKELLELYGSQNLSNN